MTTVSRDVRLKNSVHQSWVESVCAPSSYSRFTNTEKTASRRFIRTKSPYQLRGLGKFDGKTLSKHMRIPTLGTSLTNGEFRSNRVLRETGKSQTYRPLVLDLKPVAKAGRAGGSRYWMRQGAAASYQRYIERPGSMESNTLGDFEKEKEGVFHNEEGFSSYGSLSFSKKERVKFWNNVELMERSGGRVQYRIIAELPYDIEANDRMRIVARFGEEFGKRGLAWHGVVHLPENIATRDSRSDPRNYHMHLVYYDRVSQLDERGIRSFGLKDRSAQGKSWVVHLREIFSRLQNDVLEEYQSRYQPREEQYWNFSRRITPKSYEWHEMDGFIPQKHLGPRITSIERKGIVTEKGLHNVASQSFCDRRAGLERFNEDRVNFEGLLREGFRFDNLLKQVSDVISGVDQGKRVALGKGIKVVFNEIDRRSTDLRDKANDVYEILSDKVSEMGGIPSPLQTEWFMRRKAGRQDDLSRIMISSRYGKEAELLERAKVETLQHIGERHSGRRIEELRKILSDQSWSLEEGIRSDADDALEILSDQEEEIVNFMKKPSREDFLESLAEEESDLDRQREYLRQQRIRLLARISKILETTESDRGPEEIFGTVLRLLTPKANEPSPTPADWARATRDYGVGRILGEMQDDMKEYGDLQNEFGPRRSKYLKKVRDHESGERDRQSLHYLDLEAEKSQQDKRDAFERSKNSLTLLISDLDKRLYLPSEHRQRIQHEAVSRGIIDANVSTR